MFRARSTTAFILNLSLVMAAFGQQPQPSAQRTESPPAKAPEFVEEKGFKGKVFEVKHRDPGDLAQTVGNLGSGFKGAKLSYSHEFKTITVRDFPENIAAIEEALKRLDTPVAPQPPRPDVEFRVHVLIASSTPVGSGEFPADLSSVIKQLQSTLNYKNYGLMTSSIHRTKEGSRGVSNNGVAESKLFSLNTPQGNPIFYTYNLQHVSLDKNASGASTIQVGDFNFSMRIPLNLGSTIQYENVGFRTPVSVREGEKVVVGTTTMGDKGLIVVLMANVVK